MKRNLPIIMCVFALFTSTFGQSDDRSTKKSDKISVDEIVTKHLAAIGPSEELSANRSRVLTGEGTLLSKLGASFLLNGTAQLTSEGDKVIFAMLFNSPIYPYERVAFDGKDVTVGLPSGKETVIGSYISAENVIVKRRPVHGRALECLAIT